MLLLAIDTSTSAITVALHDGGRVLAEVTSVDPRAHGERLAPNLHAALQQAGCRPTDVTAVAVGVGPGPYTGLRVGIMTARTFGFACDVPVHGVCSLDAIAWHTWTEARARDADRGGAGPEADAEMLVTTDARRREVYWARYSMGGTGVIRVAGPSVDRPAAVAQRHPGMTAAGRGADLYADLLGPRVGPLDVSASFVAVAALRALESGAPLLAPDPLYLRRPDAAESHTPKPVLR